MVISGPHLVSLRHYLVKLANRHFVGKYIVAGRIGLHTTIVKSASLQGLESSIVTIESRTTNGNVGLQIVGNAAEVCRDGKERAKVALEQIGIGIPAHRILINLAPADVKKDGNHFDLPIAVSLILLIKQPMCAIAVNKWVFCAELSLSGKLRPAKGVVSFALSAAAQGLQGIVVAKDNIRDIATLTSLGGHSFHDFKVLGFDHLQDVFAWIQDGSEPAAASQQLAPRPLNSDRIVNFDDMLLSKSQQKLIKTIGVGMHSAMLSGTPGCGKSMLAERLTSVFPTMPRSHHLESLQIQSLVSKFISPALLQGRPPFRYPHHQTSAAAILGTPENPGELSLAHGGVLFLDEFPEFRRDIIESLREPLESGVVQVSRAKQKTAWSSKVLLLAARNNCPCGWFGSQKRMCSCGPAKRLQYLTKLSGPILDRIDIHYNFPETIAQRQAILKALKPPKSSQTALLRQEIVEARQRASKRNARFGCELNRDLKPQNLIAASGMSESAFDRCLTRYTSSTYSARSIVRTLRVARTLADLDGEVVMNERHFRQAWDWQYEVAAKSLDTKIMIPMTGQTKAELIENMGTLDDPKAEDGCRQDSASV